MKHSLRKINFGLIFLLAVSSLLAFFWPCYRAFLPIMINTNEGWNAFFADAAMGKMPLYPSLDQLITNNYPPLSFYLVGSLGKVLGDPIFAGRILSLLAVLTITFFIGKVIEQLGGGFKAAIIGGAYFLGTMSLSFRWYVGVNDPQLLAEAIMIIGFFLFLKAIEKDTGYFLPIFIMILAGFFKHNIITFPCSAMLGLIVRKRWRIFFFSALFAGVIVATGLACCYACYGIDFFYNFLTPRSWIPGKAIAALCDLKSLFLGIMFWLFVALQEREKTSIQWMTLMMLLALLVGFLQRLGSGVFVNAQFDLVIVISIGMGVGFQFLMNQKKELPQSLWLLFFIGTFLASPNFDSFSQIFSSAGRAQIEQEKKEMNRLIDEVKNSPVDVFCETYITYRAGKPFVVDAFNVQERIKAHQLPADAVDRLIREGRLISVKRPWLVGEE